MSEGPRAGAAIPAAVAIGLLTERGQTLATAESLTGGMLAGALTAVPGASSAFRGGVVAYAADLKALLLGVDEDLLARYGTIHRLTALAMATGVRSRLTATFGLATTGVAGPDPAEGHVVGTVHIAVACAAGSAHRELRLAGDRRQIRSGTVSAALDLLVTTLREDKL